MLSQDKVYNQVQSSKEKKPFLRRGEGIARFGLKQCRVKFKKKGLPATSCDQKAEPVPKAQSATIIARNGDGGGEGNGGGMKPRKTTRKVAEEVRRAPEGNHNEINIERREVKGDISF